MSIPGLIVAGIFFAAGMLGTFLPVLPGAPLILIGMLIYGFFEQFANLTWQFFFRSVYSSTPCFRGGLSSGNWGVKRFGGSKHGIYGSLIGAVLGIFVLGPLGIILGPFLGAVVGELIAYKKPIRQSGQVSAHWLVSWVGVY
ncbi:hypothetical protein N752_06375 [Desulforamulus aquiferis]|nr:hypothetical protein N752_06375 [Desulforamulus aquiferis]